MTSILAEVNNLGGAIPWFETFKILASLLVSAFVAWLTAKFTLAREQRRFVLEEIKHLVHDLQTQTEGVVTSVDLHLQGQSSDGLNPDQAHRGILAAVKTCGSKVHQIRCYLPSDHHSKLDAGFLEWKQTVTGSPFPLQKKKDALQAHDPAIKALHDAQSKLVRFLSELLRDCMLFKIRFWRIDSISK